MVNILNEIIENLDIHAKGFWCPITWTIILVLVVLFVPKKKMNWLQIYCTYGVLGTLAWVANCIFGISLNLVDFGSAEWTGIGEMLNYTLIPSSLGILYLNNFRRENRLLRTLMFMVLSLFVEWTCHAAGFMGYNHWSLLYSVPIYFIIYYFVLPLHYRIIRTIGRTGN